MAVGGRAQLVQQGSVRRGNLGVLLVEQAVLHPRREQQLQVESGRLGDAKVGRNRLALDGGLDLTVFNVAPQRGVKPVGVAPAPCRRSAPSIEEHDGSSVVAAHLREVLFGPVNRPIRTEVASIFGAVRESEHDGLVAVPRVEVRRINGVGVQTRHFFLGPVQVFNGLEQRHQVDRQRSLPSTGQRHGVQHRNVQGP